MKDMISQEYLKSILSYDEGTGLFVWKVAKSNRKPGDIAGGLTGDGYIRIRIDSEPFLAHRLAFLYLRGSLPKNMIDHINGVKTDNRMANLREVNCSVNMQNQRFATSGNSTGLLGASVCRGKYQSQIKVKGKNIYLGLFDTAEEAHGAYVSAKRLIHEGCSI